MISVRRDVRLIVIAVASLTLDSIRAEEQGQITSRITRQPVHSHALAAIGYSKRLHALEVEFVNGAIYRYNKVPPEIYRDLLGAPSKTQFYDANIRGRFPSVHVKPRRS